MQVKKTYMMGAPTKHNFYKIHKESIGLVQKAHTQYAGRIYPFIVQTKHTDHTYRAALKL